MTRLALGLAIAIACGCHHEPWYARYPPPRPIAVPIPIAGINSPYDDFNSIDVERWVYSSELIFSTNRGSRGHDFDLYRAKLHWGHGEPVASPVRADEPVPFAPALMSDGDERGPIVIDGQGSRDRLVFASDRPGGAGGLDLYSAECEPDGTCLALRPVLGLDSPADDAYLTRPFADHRMLFASTRGGGTHNDLYAASWDPQDTIDALPQSVDRVDALSTAADDTAPFVYERAPGEIEVVFVSDRPGGLGEHDLYCARFADLRPESQREAERAARPYDARRWTAPVHLAELGSERDEYRPIVVEQLDVRYLIFSSTRTGGLGGYDLYIVSYAGCPAA